MPLQVVPLASFAGAFLGCLATLYLSWLGLPPALASASATLLLCAALVAAPSSNLVPTTFSSSAYGGSFCGMMPIAMLTESVARAGLPVTTAPVLLAAFCGLMFLAVCALEVRLRAVLLRGYGGRFGALAAVASFLFLSLVPMLGPDHAPVRLAGLDRFDKGIVDSLIIFQLCLTGAIATMLALRLPRVASAGRAARIFVSATVAFAGLLILQQLRPDDICFADSFYAGCFIGMSSPHRLRSLVQPVLAAAVLTIVLVKGAASLPSVGGSMGFVAFVSVIGVDLASRMAERQPLLGRAVAVALTIAGMLLPNDLFNARPAEETTGSIVVPAATAAAAPAAALEAPAVEQPVPAASIPAPVAPIPSAEPTPDAAVAVVQPLRSKQPRPRRPSVPALPQTSFASGPWSMIGPGQTEALAAAPPAVRRPAAKRSQVRRAPDARPTPATAATPPR
ncbi:hypothetical protein ACQR1I_34575 [Bradyrhizobium sp. HKCCYLS2038]|uniref:hypothetical protein n=1 Tax=unclassified Bradyrhizobium TaxID=2631580 RepID=UPI003EC1193D